MDEKPTTPTPTTPKTAEAASIATNGSWELDAQTIKGRTLREVRISSDGGLLLTFDCMMPEQAPFYLGFKVGVYVTGSYGNPRMAVYTFPQGVPEDALSRTQLLLPNETAPPNVNAIIGRKVVNCYPNTQEGLRIPPSIFPGGWFIDLEGEYMLESNITGLQLHAPHLLGGGNLIQ